MSLYVQPNDKKPILVFLPASAASTIVSKLIENGYAATSVSSVPELFDALRSDRHALIVARRPDIDIVRNIRSVPVVNVEVFFHAVPSPEKTDTSAKHFDGKAFLHRIKALTEPRLNRNVITADRIAVAISNPVARGPSRWWGEARLILKSRISSGAEGR
jgi:hypothetical protein